ncbi:Cystathionine gamma synthase [Thalictrum thalictroides]|uniref:plant cystathionine gamma-synthase n=1 Tax=Thalictrum thalictroides TaxID=46969 RepID=A0A7J6UXT8_THATH|nr:Cystathionine gamma synthase [Thalictrum thalictroides]
MAVAGGFARVLPLFECRSDPDFSTGSEKFNSGGNRFTGKANSFPICGSFNGLSSSLIFRFPPNFVRQLSIKARRNCSNIGVAQVVAASWSNNNNNGGVPNVSAVDSAAASTEIEIDEVGAAVGVNGGASKNNNNGVQLTGLAALKASFLCSDGSIAIHAGERLGRGIVTDGITTPVVNTTAYWFKNSDELIDFKEGRYASFEYGRYGNPTTESLERKISALERAETTLFLASGMCASTVLMFALVKKGGHIVTTTDCYRKTRIFLQDYLVPNMDITVTVIDPADIDGLQSALDQNNVSLFFTESPTNPYLRCVDIELVSKICHSKGALVCIDGTFATPLNQKALSLGADIVLNSATKYIGGHNDVIGGCISGSEEVVSKIRKLHHVLGGVLNPNAAYLFIRGIKTLHVRIKQQNSTALEMARILEAHPKIARVHYPGLPSHPDHDIAMQQMTGFGGVVSFEVDGDLHTTKKFIDALKIPYIAPSFGGCESIVDQPAIMSYWDLTQDGRAMFGIKDNLVRFSFGLEDFEDLKSDILQALATL